MKKRLLTVALGIVLALGLCACSPAPARSIESTPTDDGLIVSIFAYEPNNEPNYGLLYLGHAFLSFENRTDAAVTIGGMTLQPDESCSLGTWSMTHHFGTWYNVESKYIDAAGRYAGRVSVSKTVDPNCLDAVNDYIANNDKWSPTTNCSRFATEIFNRAGGDTIELSGLATPTKLAERIRRFTDFAVNRPITGYGKVGYLDKQGVFTEYVYAA